MNRPLVSIVTPSFNQAPFLEQTLRSVLDQDYPLIEYQVIDGLSSDGSQEIIARHAGRLAYWVSEADGGQSEAINKGFARATGEIIAWLNSDDFYLPGAVSGAVQAFQENPQAVLVFSDVVSVDGAGEPFQVMRAGDWGLEDLLQFRIISQPGVFMRRSALLEAGYLNPSYHFLLDHQLWLRLARSGPIRYVPARWACARFHAEAKNIRQAAAFGVEADRLVEWIASQPEYEDEWCRLQRRIYAGADRLNGYYLLEAGEARAALRRYLQGLRLAPDLLLPEWRRILYAALSPLLPLESLKKAYLTRRARRVRDDLQP